MIGGALPSLPELLGALRDSRWPDEALSLAMLAVAFVAGRAVAWLVLRWLRRWAAHTASKADDALVEYLPGPLRLLLPSLAIQAALAAAPLRPSLLERAQHVALIVVIVACGFLAYRLVRVGERLVELRYDLSTGDNLEARAVFTQLRGFRNIAGFVIVVVTLSFALMTFGAVRSIGAGLLASAGVAGIVLGFAAQKTIATLLAGIQIAISQPIRVDDVVVIEGEWGRIDEITLTYVVVRIWDLRRLVVPISYFIERPFQNWTRASAELLGTVELRFDWSVPVDELRAELRRLCEASPLWDGKVCGVQVTDSDARTMLVRMLVSAADSGKVFDLRCEVRERLIGFVRTRYPLSLPRVRADLSGEVPAEVRRPLADGVERKRPAAG
ncbi:MAG: mechanosensitive ion channel [Deltaproteobacteria bacterium]|nr:mechanosensitive ion channel [Deltaproteobacteria bacterium]